MADLEIIDSTIDSRSVSGAGIGFGLTMGGSRSPIIANLDIVNSMINAASVSAAELTPVGLHGARHSYEISSFWGDQCKH
jgi:hypothetical protein